MAKQKPEKPKNKPEKKERDSFSLTRNRLNIGIVFAFSFIIYFNSVFNGYNMDDELVTQNHRLTSKGISAIPEIFSSPYYEDKAGYKYEYRPIVLVSFAIENSLFGEHTAVSHFINVLLYSLLCLVLFGVLKKLLQQYSIVFPFLITLIFAAHPIHSEVVASIKNRDEILSLMFGLLSLDFALRFSERRNSLSLFAMVLFFLLGILSKTTIITFVLIIPLSLILLTEISFVPLMILTAALIVPAALFARLYSVMQQIGLVFLLFAATLFFYSLKNPKLVLAAVRAFAADFMLLVKTQNIVAATEQTLDFSFLKNKLALFSFISVSLALLLISAAGVYSVNLWLGCAPLFLLALVFISVREELKLLLITPLSLLTVYALVSFHPNPVALEAALQVLLASAILYGNKWFRITGWANYIVYTVVAVVFNHSPYPVTLLVFLGLANKRTFLITVAFIAVSVGFYIKSVVVFFTQHNTDGLSLLNLPIIYAALALVWKQKTKWALHSSVVLITLLTGVYFTIAVPRVPNVTGVIQHSYSQMNNTVATDLTPVQAVRPLVYMEIPVDKNSPLDIRLGTAMLILGKYLKLAFVPYPMSFYYGYATISPVSITDAVSMFSLAVYLALLGAALLFFRKQPLLAYSILFYLIAVAVFSNLVIPIPGMMGDRFLFIPSIGFSVFLVFILSKIFKQDLSDKTVDLKTLAQPFKTSLAVILVLYSVVTFSRNSDWKDRLTLFRHDINSVENSAQAQNLLGLHLFLASNTEPDMIKRNQLREEALPHLKRALEIYPKFLNAAFDYGRLLEAMGRKDEALAAYRQAVSIDTGFTTPYFSMGIIYQNQGKQQEAVNCYEIYLIKHPQQLEIYANLSFAYFKMQQYDKSIATNHRALAANPGAFDPTVNIAKTYKQIGVNDSALYYFEQSLLLRPNDPNVASAIAELKNKK